jgi:alpha-N-arabinofuranosidase
MGSVIRAAIATAALANSAPAFSEIRARAFIDARATGATIRPEVYGQFAEHLGTGIEDGIWVGPSSTIPNIRGYRKDVVDALKRLQVPVIRWPGGCFADIYRWRDGVGPRERRPVTLNKWWGNAEERNQFGTHEFFDFAELIGAKTYLNINVGTGTPGEAREWVEYVSSSTNSTLAQARRANGRNKPWKIDYVGIGNEMWGCGGNLKASEFAPMARMYATFLKEPGTALIAGGATGDDYGWTDEIMEKHDQFDAVSLHYYTLPTGDWARKGSAIGFDKVAWTQTFDRTRKLETMIIEHGKRMDAVDPSQKKGLMVAEWGTWYDVTPGTNSAFLQQENTLRDALVAATNLNIFHRHAGRVHMANIAQMVNVLQAMILTDGPRMTLTPTYHSFMMYRPFQGAKALAVSASVPDYVTGAMRMPALDITAAKDQAGTVHIGIVNVDPEDNATVDLDLAGVDGRNVEAQLLTAAQMDSRNTIGKPAEVVPVSFTKFSWNANSLRLKLPSKSVVRLSIRK